MRLSPIVAALGTTLAALAAPAANAMLVYDGTVDLGGSGLGAVSTVLTLQSPGNSSVESGGVARMVGSTVDLITGDASTGASQTQTQSLGALGLSSAADLRIVFNTNEPGHAAGNGITLQDVQLNIYGADGSLLYNSGAFTPQTFAQTLGGTGSSGFVFRLDAEQAAAAQAAAFGPGSEGHLIGLSATATGATGGAETFYVAAAPVPEPAQALMLLPGLAMLVGFMKLRRRREEA
jgi:hypothetical protein